MRVLNGGGYGSLQALPIRYRRETCPKCKGAGLKTDYDTGRIEDEPCPECGGDGEWEVKY